CAVAAQVALDVRDVESRYVMPPLFDGPTDGGERMGAVHVPDDRNDPVLLFETLHELKVVVRRQVVPLAALGILRQKEVTQGRIVRVRRPAVAVELEAESGGDEGMPEPRNGLEVGRGERDAKRANGVLD